MHDSQRSVDEYSLGSYHLAPHPLRWRHGALILRRAVIACLAVLAGSAKQGIPSIR